MEVFGLAALVALGMKVLSLLKFVRAGETSRAVDLVASWLVGILVAFVAAEATLAQGIVLLGVPLGDMNPFDKILAGMSLLSLGGVVYDYNAARDETRSSKEPKLLTGKYANQP